MSIVPRILCRVYFIISVDGAYFAGVNDSAGKDTEQEKAISVT